MFINTSFRTSQYHEKHNTPQPKSNSVLLKEWRERTAQKKKLTNARLKASLEEQKQERQWGYYVSFFPSPSLFSFLSSTFVLSPFCPNSPFPRAHAHTQKK